MGYVGYKQGRAAVAVQASVRSVVVASADREMRQRISEELRAMRWEVREAGGGAEALSQLNHDSAEAIVLDHWLPDLEVEEVTALLRSLYPEMEILRSDGVFEECAGRSPRRGELLLAMRQGDAKGGASAGGAVTDGPLTIQAVACSDAVEGVADGCVAEERVEAVERGSWEREEAAGWGAIAAQPARAAAGAVRVRREVAALPEMVGESAGMRELAWLIRLVAPRSTPVLIEGATGTGKELVAKAVHRLSARAGKPYVVLNCAAIPESLLEAELFGHTRGAFTGAVQSRVGRVEAANGGTLFLDEIGEMPLALQAKMLRFLECGEIQRVGGNETMRVDVRIVAATHQPLKQRTGESAFRLDLYHRLAVFPVSVPALKERMEDVPALARFFLERLGEEMPVKRLSAGAERLLMGYDWPGNVRELAHVLERATILAEDRLEITEREVRL
ncbi:MAG: sigma-54 dependent transcriptional regulator [Acidobacteriota bacterium]|nr:sigma-54 dependent transcriptional regulator [Acidobacteriota bacterium]